MVEPLLEIENLRVEFGTAGGLVRAVDDVSLSLSSGEILAVVGESGSGKSVTAMSLLGLDRSRGASFAGSARFRGTELIGASPQQLRAVRGAGIAMVFQDPMTSLNPVQRVGRQIAEQIRAHEDLSARDLEAKVVELLGRVGIPRAAERARSYPHQFSGGMRQRAMIAMALSCSPSLLVADEPTTALDVTIQAQILELIKEFRDRTGAGVILVTHDLGVVADIADRVAVMYSGRIVEEGPIEQIFYDPQHPYTWGLLGSATGLYSERGERLPSIAGRPPSPLNAPSGCHFRARCPFEKPCCDQVPALAPEAGGHRSRCWLGPEERRERRELEPGVIGLATRSESEVQSS